MSKRLILSLISLGLISFLCVLIETSLNVTFDFLIQKHNINLHTASFLTSMFLLAITLLMPISSFLVYKFNTKNMFVFIILLFLLSLLICIFTENFYILIFARIIQGIVTGIALPLMFNIVILKANKNSFGFLMGFCVFLIACAPGLGPLYGGFMMEFKTFKDIFIYLIPIVILSFILGIFSIENLQNTKKAKFNLKEYIFILAIIFSLLLSVKNILFVILVLILLYLLPKTKSLIMQSMTNINFISGAFVIFFIQFSALSLSLILPNFLIDILNLDNFNAGKTMLLGCICAAILAPISGKISDRKNPFIISIIGVAILIIANLLFIYLEKKLLNFSISYLVFSIGQGMCISPIMSHIIKISSHKTEANAFLNTFQQYFGAFGVLISSLVFNNNYIIGFNNVIYILTILSLISFVLVIISFKFNKE